MQQVQSTGKPAVAPLVLYYLTLGALLALAFFPDRRFWGINWWGYLPVWTPVMLAAVGALVPLVTKFLTGGQNARVDHGSQTHRGNLGYWSMVGCLTVVSGLLFYFLRAQTHFLGDGYTLLSVLSKAHPLAIKAREIGLSLLLVNLREALGGDAGRAALMSYQIVAITTGILFALVTALFSRFLFERTRERLLFLAGILTGGYMLLYFGYVENYSLFVLSVLVYTLTGLLIIKRNRGRWLLLPLLALTVFFHIFGVTLIPSALYLLLSGTRAGRAWGRLGREIRLLLLLVGLAGAAVVFHHFYTSSYFFRFSLAPFAEGRFTAEGNMLFAPKHLLDYLNLLLLLAPGLPICVAALMVTGKRGITKPREHRFLFVLLASVLGAALIFDPKLGMPRDWDLFSYAGVPLAITCYYLILGNHLRIRAPLAVAVLSISLSTLLLIPRAVSQVIPEVAVAHVHNYLAHDSLKNRNFALVLAEYYERAGLPEAAREIREWHKRFPQERMHNQAAALIESSPRQAAAQLNRIIDLDPGYWLAWTSLGECYLRMGRFDSALKVLDVAQGWNPDSYRVYSNKGAVYYRQGDYINAEKMLLKSLKIDTVHVETLMGLTALYRSLGREKDYFRYLARTASHRGAPPAILRELGDYLLSKDRFDQAARAYRNGLQKGLDSAYVSKLLEQYPLLKEQMNR